MGLGETVIRLLGGAIIGAAFGWVISTAPPSFARVLLTIFGILFVLLVVFLLVGLGRKATLFVVSLLAILLLAGAISKPLAQAAWTWVRFGADMVAMAVQAATGASLQKVLITWGLVGMLLNLVAGSVHLSRLRRVW